MQSFNYIKVQSFLRSCGHGMQLGTLWLHYGSVMAPIVISMSNGNVPELEHLFTSSSHIYCCFYNFYVSQLIKTSLKLI